MDEARAEWNESVPWKESIPQKKNIPEKKRRAQTMAPKTSKAQKNALKTASELPYERFKRFGPENLTEIELLAIILRTGTKDNHVLQVAEEVMSLAR